MTNAMDRTAAIVSIGKANWRTDLKIAPKKSPGDIRKKIAERMLANMHEVPPADIRFRLNIAGYGDAFVITGGTRRTKL